MCRLANLTEMIHDKITMPLILRWDGFSELPPDWRGHVATIGNFDGVHRGHQALVHAASQLARRQGTLATAITFDPHPVTLLRPEVQLVPLTTLEDRCQLLGQAGAARVLILETTRRLLKLGADEFFATVMGDRLRLRGLVEGQTFYFGHNREGTPERLAALCAQAGLPLEVVPPVLAEEAPVSSSRVRQAVAQGDLAEAILCLGRPHWVSGRVVRGQQRGRTLGVPTANLGELKVLLPPEGVYAGRCELRGHGYAAAINLGPNPTFGEAVRKFEVHLLDFSGDLYDQELKVEMLARIRGVRSFPSVDALKQQLADDCKRVAACVAEFPREAATSSTAAAESEVARRINEVLNATIRPLLRDSGSDVRLARVDSEGVAHLAFSGTCRGCPATLATLLMGVERELLHQVPEVAYLQVAHEAE